MGKSSNGPDWTDVEMMMRAIGSLHTGQVGVTILPQGIGGSGGLSVAASIMFDVLPGSAISGCVSSIGLWPCSAHKSLDAHCFALLHELDFKIGQTYQNGKLWE
jgi:hypothetical protein